MACFLIESLKAMVYQKITRYMLISLMVAAACTGSPKENNELRESETSEEKSPVQLPMHVDVDRRDAKSLRDCFDESRQCYHHGKAGCSKDWYKGTRSYTIHGTKCQKWSADKPHDHKYIHLPENYCRNPSGAQGPWCYTTNPKRFFDFCFIDCSADECFDSKRNCFHYGKRKCSMHFVYNGTRSYTFDGIKCHEWRSYQVSINVGYSFLPENYCRNPEGYKNGPWCFGTKDIQDRGWNYCFADCAGDDCFQYKTKRFCFKRNEKCRDSHMYNGTRNFNLDGENCVNWSLFGIYGLENLPENKCRNPDKRLAPWCFTDERTKRWNYCFDDCYEYECYDESRNCFHYGKAKCNGSATYNGLRNRSIDGTKCQKWYPYGYEDISLNYCRNPNGRAGPWCYLMQKAWDYCFPSCDADKCYDSSRQCYRYGNAGCTKPYAYTGTRYYTIGGLTCHYWRAHGRDDIPLNYCGNPDGKAGPWCYAGNGWDYCFSGCNIETCYDHSRNCFHYGKAGCTKMSSYIGTRNHSINGAVCQPWKKYHDSGLAGNLCRDPSGGAKGPFCYIHPAIKEWNYCFKDCTVGRCYDSSLDCFHYGKAECREPYAYLGKRDYTQGAIGCWHWHSDGIALPHNYCRVRYSGDKGPWCYTHESGGPKWRYCFVDCKITIRNPWNRSTIYNIKSLRSNSFAGYPVMGMVSCGMFGTETECQEEADKCFKNPPYGSYSGQCHELTGNRHYCICFKKPYN